MQTKEATVSGRGLVTSSWDLLVTAAILETKPNWVIQVGARSMLSILFSGYILDQIGGDLHSVIGVVNNGENLPQKRNVYFLEGNPLDPSMPELIKKWIRPKDKVMVILQDGLKARPIVEIQTYAPLVTEGCYLVMDEGVDAFVRKHITFEPDWIMPKPQIYLRKR